MPSLFSKHLHLCFFKHKHATIPSSTPPSSTDNSTTFPFSDTTSTSTSTSSTATSTEPDFASIFASQRFFFSSPGTSNSIIQSPDTRTLLPTAGGVKVPKYSLNPYVDFLRSMQEMISSRQDLDVTKDWDYLHELLLCYLALNPTHTHKYIVRAFSHLVLQLLSSTPCPIMHNNNNNNNKKHRRHHSFSGRLV